MSASRLARRPNNVVLYAASALSLLAALCHLTLEPTVWPSGGAWLAVLGLGIGPIGLAFFMHSTVTNCVVAMYPSPAGATESELHFETWSRLVEMNPVLRDLEPDAEALIVNRISHPPAFAIAPIDRCYMLVGLIKASWEGISGGAAVEEAIDGYFEELRKVAA